jgi:response regulator NasT
MAQRRLIVADDDGIVRMDVIRQLKNLGYLVVGEAIDGTSAINLARQLKPDLVMMDIRMPQTDGIEAARVLTEERVAPVVLLSNYSERELAERASGAGVVAYLVKPVREADLMPAIEVALARFAQLRELDKEVGDLKESLEARIVIEKAKGILMRDRGITEDQAYTHMRELSMRMRKKMKEIAEAIILASEITA